MLDVSCSCCSSGFLVFSFSVSTSEEFEVVQPETNRTKVKKIDERRTPPVCQADVESCDAPSEGWIPFLISARGRKRLGSKGLLRL